MPRTVISKSAVDQLKFEALYRSAKNIQGALTVGSSHEKFTGLLQALATEISIAEDKAASDDDRKLVDLYTEALEMLQDSLMLWDAQLKWPMGVIANPQKDDGFIFEERFLRDGMNLADGMHDAKSDPEVMPVFRVIRKYPSLFKDLHKPRLSKYLVEMVWVLAGAKLEQAAKAYYAWQHLVELQNELGTQEGQP
jgi:hypothetical protein